MKRRSWLIKRRLEERTLYGQVPSKKVMQKSVAKVCTDVSEGLARTTASTSLRGTDDTL